jgi:hypothetical protein
MGFEVLGLRYQGLGDRENAFSETPVCKWIFKDFPCVAEILQARST